MTTNIFNVALLQLYAGGTQRENMEKGLDACRRAKEMGADVALFPEMWNIGYGMDVVDANAMDKDGEFFAAYRNLAKELNMAIALTYLERFSPSPRNTVTLIDRFGSPVLTYAKVHTCDFGVERALTRGEDYYVAELDTEGGMVKVGAMICYDREFPESARILMLKGAEIILVPNACPMEINRLTQLRTRAFENMVGIATANYPDGYAGSNGHSSAFDGIGFEGCHPEPVVPRDSLIVEAGEEEGIYLASFSMDKIRENRRREIQGNAYRRPSTYHMLTSAKVDEPFIRKDSRP